MKLKNNKYGGMDRAQSNVIFCGCSSEGNVCPCSVFDEILQLMLTL